MAKNEPTVYGPELTGEQAAENWHQQKLDDYYFEPDYDPYDDYYEYP